MSRATCHADELPLWLDNIYVASADSPAAASHEVFAWISRDLWMTNVTMHALEETPAQAIWTDDLTLVEGARSPPAAGQRPTRMYVQHVRATVHDCM